MNINIKKIIAFVVTVLVIIDIGLLVATSDTAMPGEILYQVDLAVEKIEVYLAPVDTQASLKFKFTDERISEVEQLIKGRRLEIGHDSIDFTVRESNDINTALKDVGIFLEKNTDAIHKTQIEKHLAKLLALIELDKNVRIERHGGSVEMDVVPEANEVPVKSNDGLNTSDDVDTSVGKPSIPTDDELDFEDEGLDD